MRIVFSRKIFHDKHHSLTWVLKNEDVSLPTTVVGYLRIWFRDSCANRHYTSIIFNGMELLLLFERKINKINTFNLNDIHHGMASRNIFFFSLFFWAPINYYEHSFCIKAWVSCYLGGRHHGSLHKCIFTILASHIKVSCMGWTHLRKFKKFNLANSILCIYARITLEYIRAIMIAI